MHSICGYVHAKVGHLHIAFLAKICLLRSVEPDGSVILYRPSCSGKTRRAGFLLDALPELSVSSTLIPTKFHFINLSFVNHYEFQRKYYFVLMLSQLAGLLMLL